MPNEGQLSAHIPPYSNGIRDPLAAATPSRSRWWLYILMFGLTLVTTSVMGAGFVRAFEQNEPVDIVQSLYGYLELLSHPGILIVGLPFSLTLVGILLSHELGHYLTCLHYRVDATPPFFIPFPAPIGTFGAFIRIRAPIYSKRILFDIAAGGPLAGFAVLLPALAAGVKFAKVLPGIAEHGELVFGLPWIVRLLENYFFPGVPYSDIYLHPVARAAWVGVLATALNLLPIGQLDGGHILYAFAGERTRILSRILVALLIPLGLLYSYSWLVWAAFLFFFGMRHPAIYDSRPLDGKRKMLGWLALAILILCFTVEPIRR